MEQSDGAWSSPTVLVSKRDGSTHFCIYYRRLKFATKMDAHPLPYIDDSLNTLNGQIGFSDLASCYWQVKLTNSAKKQHLRYIQGYAPAIFERLIGKILYGLQGGRCLVYNDDILSVGKLIEDALLGSSAYQTVLSNHLKVTILLDSNTRVHPECDRANLEVASRNCIYSIHCHRTRILNTAPV